MRINLIRLLILVALGGGVYSLTSRVYVTCLTSDISGAAFWGAFFSFLFVAIGAGIKGIIERRRKHHNSLVGLEYVLNEALSVTSFNISQLIGLLESIEKTQKSKTIQVQYLTLKEYKIDRETVLGLFDINLLNTIFTLFVDMSYLNDNQKEFLNMYQDMRSRYLTDIRAANETEKRKQIAGDYRTHLLFLEKQALELMRSLKDAEEGMITALSKTRIRLKGEILFQQIFKGAPEDKEAEILETKKRIREEMSKCCERAKSEKTGKGADLES